MPSAELYFLRAVEITKAPLTLWCNAFKKRENFRLVAIFNYSEHFVIHGGAILPR